MERFTQLKNEEICQIIEIAARCNVKTLKFGELEIVYNSEDINKVENTPVTHTEYIEPPAESDNGQPQSEDLQKFDDDQILEQDFENLLLEDPERYEELLATEKLDEFGSPTTQL